MPDERGRLTTGDGLSLSWKARLPESGPKAVVHVIHGYAEHFGRYANVEAALLTAGYALIGNDHRGHGTSEGKRAYISSFEEYLNDEQLFRDEVIKQRFPDIPSFILGHSMGSIIALNLAERTSDRLAGLVLSGTGSVLSPGIPRILALITRLLSRLAPGIHVKSPLPPDFISRDPEVVAAYVNDPLVFNVITPRLAEQMGTYTAQGAQNAGRVKVPVLVQYGSLDTSFGGQQELFEALGSADKTIRRYEGLKHEVYNELPADRAAVLADLKSWLDARL